MLENYLFLDYETASNVDLNDVGTDNYAAHKSTRILCVTTYDGAELITYMVNDGYPPFINQLNVRVLNAWTDLERVFVGKTLIAHNASFESVITETFITRQPLTWLDTAQMARSVGLAGGLDKAAKALGGVGKTDDGVKALRSLTNIPIKAGKLSPIVGTPALWRKMIEYNQQDVIETVRIFNECYRPELSEEMAVDFAVNRRGVSIDTAVLLSLKQAYEYNERIQQQAFAQQTNDINPRSVKQVQTWLESLGVNVPSLNKLMLNEFFENPEVFADPDCDKLNLAIEMLKRRQEIVRVGSAKLTRILQQVNTNNKLRWLLVYHGAVTGRWTGRAFQPQNLPRGLDASKLDVQTVVEKMRAGTFKPELDIPKEHYADALNTLVRCVITSDNGPLAIADYATIEVRALAWISGQDNLLQAFATDSDVYKGMASKLFNVPVNEVNKQQRQIAKTIILGCGYGMSVDRFGSYCKANRIDLDAVGLTAKDCVESYRKNHQNIAGENGVWRRCDIAVIEATRFKKTVSVARCQFHHDGQHLFLTLPSGRYIVYRNARVEDRVPKFCQLLGIRPFKKPTLIYDRPTGAEGQLYGGLIVENICQAISRDVLTTALIECEKHGLRPVLHVHDELVCDTEKLAEMLKIMTATPQRWAAEFPLKAEGFLSTHYGKSGIGYDLSLTAFNGELKRD